MSKKEPRLTSKGLPDKRIGRPPKAIQEAQREAALEAAMAVAPVLEPLNEQNWAKLLDAVSAGAVPQAAITALNISPSMVDGALREQPKMLEAWNLAKIKGGRINWPRETITAICSLVASGQYSVRQACVQHGKNHQDFLKLALRDPEIKEEYELALQVRAETFADETIELADDRDKDEDWDGRGNSAAVKRSELRIRTRMELAKAANPSKYREKGWTAPPTNVNVQANVQNNNTTQVNVQANLNLAERLSAARRRKQQAQANNPHAALPAPPVVDAQFTEANKEPDDWLDNPKAT